MKHHIVMTTEALTTFETKYKPHVGSRTKQQQLQNYHQYHLNLDFDWIKYDKNNNINKYSTKQRFNVYTEHYTHESERSVFAVAVVIWFYCSFHPALDGYVDDIITFRL